MNLVELIFSAHPDNIPPEPTHDTGLEVHATMLASEISDHKPRAPYLANDLIVDSIQVVEPVNSERLVACGSDSRLNTLVEQHMNRLGEPHRHKDEAGFSPCSFDFLQPFPSFYG
jgi:hypothetical protein